MFGYLGLCFAVFFVGLGLMFWFRDVICLSCSGFRGLFWWVLGGWCVSQCVRFLSFYDFYSYYFG